RLSFRQRCDGILTLAVYAIPPILLSGFLANMLLFLMGALSVWSAVALGFFVVAYSAFGNFGPIYEIGAAEVLDGARQRLYLLPYLFYLFLFNSWAVTSGLLDTLGDGLKRRSPLWEKTTRTSGDRNAVT
ncbi:MAG: glycosyltransferase family 2 protein, partial [Vulcanimicrobiaceae bacterium]